MTFLGASGFLSLRRASLALLDGPSIRLTAIVGDRIRLEDKLYYFLAAADYEEEEEDDDEQRS